MANISAQSAQQSKDAVEAVEPQCVAAIDIGVESDSVHKLSEKRKLAEKYLIATRCSSRDFEFMAMCDDQNHMPFCCEWKKSFEEM